MAWCFHPAPCQCPAVEFTDCRRAAEKPPSPRESLRLPPSQVPEPQHSPGETLPCALALGVEWQRGDGTDGAVCQGEAPAERVLVGKSNQAWSWKWALLEVAEMP